MINHSSCKCCNQISDASLNILLWSCLEWKTGETKTLNNVILLKKKYRKIVSKYRVRLILDSANLLKNDVKETKETKTKSKTTVA